MLHKVERTALLAVPAGVAYGVVTDVLRYPEFLPGCKAVKVLETTASGLIVEVAIAGHGLHETFITDNQHRPEESVRVSLREGPFERLEGEWRFTALGDAGCRVDLHIEFLPRGLLARLLSGFAGRLANPMVDAFSRRIVDLHQASAGSSELTS